MANENTTFEQYKLPEPEAPVISGQDVAVQNGLESDASIMRGGASQQSSNYVPGTSGWYLGATFAEFNFGVSVASLNIPDTTTSNSFHVDTSGNAWWGSNVAGGYAAATAYILSTGEALFKNIKIGGANIQYQVVNSGIFSFGDGSDGAGVADGSTALAGASLGGSTYTLSRDVYYTDLTISTGVIIKPAGYRIFGTGILTMNGTANINATGNNGSDGSLFGAGGAGGGALAAGYLAAGSAGGLGGTFNAGHTSPVAGGSQSNCVDTSGVGGSGGSGGDPGGGSQHDGGASGGAATASNVKLIANWHLATLLDIGSTGATVKFTSGTGGGGGGGGGSGDAGNSSGSGGGGGGAGGMVAVYFRSIIIGASASVTAAGGTGGAGQNGKARAVNFDGGGGGGGGGGAGGTIVLVYNALTNSGSLAAAGGTGGAKGLKGGSNGNDGTIGSTGGAGTIYQFQISL